jgi:hypothetical protein
MGLWETLSKPQQVVPILLFLIIIIIIHFSSANMITRNVGYGSNGKSPDIK